MAAFILSAAILGITELSHVYWTGVSFLSAASHWFLGVGAVVLLTEVGVRYQQSADRRLERETQERRRTEAELWRVTARQEAILAAVHDIIMIVDKDCTYTWANKAGYDFFGEEVVGRPVSEYVADVQGLAERLAPVLRDEQSVVYIESWHRRVDGEKRLLASWCRALKDKEGDVTGALLSCRDITGSKHLESALRQSEERFRQLFDHAPVGYHELDRNGSITKVNHTELEMLGYELEDMLGHPVWEFIEEGEAAKESVAAKMAGKAPEGRAFERTYIRKDGSRLPVLIEDDILRDGDRNIAGMRSTIQDITRRKQAEAALRLVEFAVDHVSDSAFWVGPEGRILYVNQAACRSLGYERDELLELTVYDIDPVVKPDKWAAHWDETKRKGSRVIESTQRRKDGTLLPVEITANYVVFEGKEYNCCFARDITERKRMEESLRELSFRDELTGLYNRRGFFSLARQEIKIAKKEEKPLLLIFADLDKMKWINDSFGHLEGDHALKEAAQVLQQTFRRSDVVARMGGDEFAVLAMDSAAVNAELLVSRLREELERRNEASKKPYELQLSLGVCRYDPERPLTLDEMLSRADTLMYEDKRNKEEAGNRVPSAQPPPNA